MRGFALVRARSEARAAYWEQGKRIAALHSKFICGSLMNTRDTHMRIAQRVNGERLVVLGWGRAILMQLAHPLVAAGVDDHTTFRDSIVAPAHRLRATIGAMLALTFGTPAQARRAAEGINRIHDRVHGHLAEPGGRFDAGTRYSAHDPDLLTWVELTLLESLPLAYETFVGPLSDGEKNAWCREAAESVRLLGVPMERLPDTYAELQVHIARRFANGDIAVTETARSLARTLLDPPVVSMPWPLSRLHWLAAVGMLPPALRGQYRLTWTERDERALARWSRGLRFAASWTPDAVRRWRTARTPADSAV